jgi:hypothetical protein
MILSIHIPKTAGSRFREILQARYGNRLALYYGEESDRTHPLCRRRAGRFDAQMFSDLEAAGIAVLHGHFRAGSCAKFVPDPKRYWVWLREPVEQTISHYHFVQKLDRPNFHKAMIEDNALDLAGFARTERMLGFQSRWVAPFALPDLGFVGVSELFADMLPLIGLSDTARGGNVNVEKPLADRATRRELASILSDDLALYSEAMELAMRRLRARDRRASPLARFAAGARRLAGR